MELTRSHFRAAFAAALLAAAPAAHAEEVLRASGTGTALGAMRRLGTAYASANPGRRLDVLPSVGTTGALQALSQGALDIALAGRPLEPAEQALGLEAVPYARTPFVFAVRPGVGVTGVTAGDIARIYRGDLPTWPNGERVRVVLRPRTDVDSAILRAISPEIAAAADLAQKREGMLIGVTNQECNEIVARTPGAIGPTSLTQILTETERLTALAWNGVSPTVPNLASGAYPLAKTIYAVYRVPPSPEVRRFVAFLASPEARRILEETGNVPLAVPQEKGR
jgi:phosphate transport system substrate-binding protein